MECCNDATASAVMAAAEAVFLYFGVIFPYIGGTAGALAGFYAQFEERVT
jgi:hypothetical protein